ncbi:sugar transporter protein 2 [Danaus plexippus plexippus]|uniref:Sugar transporter protein 2 n=2 Tax=Danaus plexippus TaxID=13037 RepID=A0A212EJQ6_DANPL|nr:sugar transporter protein 2 [Danaus plexippus plexippus]
MFACSSILFNFLIYGLYMGAPAVIIPQMRKEAGSDNIITSEMVSWLASASSFSSLPWTIILPLVAHRYGRRVCLRLLAINTFIGNIFFYRSTTYIGLLISQIIQGMVISSAYTIAVMIMTEYVSPQYRGMILTIKSATFLWGIWISNTLGTFLPWRSIGILIFVCCFFNLSILFCPESPYWLAMKGRFEESAKTHRWIKGTSPDSEKELRTLILTQEKYLYKKSTKSKTSKNILIKMYKVVTGKNFYRPLFNIMLLICLFHFSGKLACAVYAIDIIKKMTLSEKTAYEGMLIMDGITVFCAYVGCFLTRVLKRRTQLISFSIIGISFLFILSAYLYSIKLNIITENKFISLAFLIGFSINLSCGPMIIATCCLNELTPLKHRTPFLIIFGILGISVLGFVIKISPFIFRSFDCHGAFSFYAITASIFLTGIYKYLPETKNRTILEIECLIAKGNSNIEDN